MGNCGSHCKDPQDEEVKEGGRAKDLLIDIVLDDSVPSFPALLTSPSKKLEAERKQKKKEEEEEKEKEQEERQEREVAAKKEADIFHLLGKISLKEAEKIIQEKDEEKKTPAASAKQVEEPQKEPAKLGYQESMVASFVKNARPEKQCNSISDLSSSLDDMGLQRRPSSENVTLDAYMDNHKEDFEEFLTLVNDTRWKQRAIEDNVEILQFFDEAAGLTAFKSIAEMDLSRALPDGNCDQCMLYLLETLLDVAKRPNWDVMCTLGSIPEQRLPFYRYTYVQIKTPSSLIAPRDVLLEGRLRFDKDGRIVVAVKSADHPSVPPRPGYVRATMKTGGYILERTADPKVIRVTWCGLTDANGWLPNWVKNLVAWKQGLVLAVFKRSHNM